MEDNKVKIGGLEMFGRKVAINEAITQAEQQAGVITFRNDYAELLQAIGVAIQTQSGRKPQSQREVIEGGIEVLYRQSLPPLAMKRAASIVYSYPKEQRKRQGKGYLQQIVNNELPKKYQEKILTAELDGDTAFLFLCLVSMAIHGGEKVDNHRVKITTTLSNLATMIYPSGSDKVYARKRIVDLLEKLVAAPAFILNTESKIEILPILEGRLSIHKDHGRGNRTEIYIAKELIAKARKQFYPVSLMFLSVVAGLQIGIINDRGKTVAAIPPESPPTRTTLSIVRKLYIRIKMIGNKSISGTLEELAAMSGESAGGISRNLTTSTKKALQILQARGMIDIEISSNKRRRVYTITRSKGLATIEKTPAIKEMQIDTSKEKILTLFD